MHTPEKLYPQESGRDPAARPQDQASGSQSGQTAARMASQPSTAAQTARNSASVQMHTSARKSSAGSSSGKARQASSGRKPEQQKKKQQKKSGTPWLLCFIILLIIALLVALFAGQNNAKKAANTAAAAHASVAESASEVETFGEPASEIAADHTTQTEPDSSIEQMGVEPAEEAPSDEEEPAVTTVPAEAVPEEPASFEDVTIDNSFYDSIMWAANTGIATAEEDNLFRPDDGCTRAEAITFLWRLAGEPVPDNMESSFEDMIDPNDPAYTAVMWAVENGITSGTGDNTFSPDAVVTRAQMVVFLYRYAGSPIPAPTAVTFEDVAADASYADAVTWALGAGITSGTGDNTFSPDTECTRGQVVTFLYRYAGE